MPDQSAASGQTVPQSSAAASGAPEYVAGVQSPSATPDTVSTVAGNGGNGKSRAEDTGAPVRAAADAVPRSALPIGLITSLLALAGGLGLFAIRWQARRLGRR
jgi:hypothetical protein